MIISKSNQTDLRSLGKGCYKIIIALVNAKFYSGLVYALLLQLGGKILRRVFSPGKIKKVYIL